MEARDLFWGVFGIAAWFAIPGVCLWFIVDGFKTGVVKVKLGSYSRDRDPIWFWLCIGIYSALVVWVVYLTALFAIDAYREGWRVW